MSIDPRVAAHWPFELRFHWIGARLRRCARRHNGGRWREFVDHGGEG